MRGELEGSRGGRVYVRRTRRQRGRSWRPRYTTIGDSTLSENDWGEPPDLRKQQVPPKVPPGSPLLEARKRRTCVVIIGRSGMAPAEIARQQLIAPRPSPNLGDYDDTEGTHLMNPIDIPAEWNDSALLTFEEFCALIHIPQRTVRDWRRRGVGPRFWRFNGTGRLYTTVAEVRRFTDPVNAAR